MKTTIIPLLAALALLTSCADIAMIRTAQSVASLAIPAFRPGPKFSPGPCSPEMQQAKAQAISTMGGNAR